MSAENKDDLTISNDDLVRTCEVKVKVEVEQSEDEELLVPLVDPLTPSSDFVPTTRRYETRKRRHAKTVWDEGSDHESDKGSDWEPEDVEVKVKKTPQKNIKKVKIIKVDVDDGLRSGSTQRKCHTESGEQVVQQKRQRPTPMTREESLKRHREAQRRRRQKLKSAPFEATGERTELDVKCSGSEPSPQTDNEGDNVGVTEPLEKTASQPGTEVQRKRGRPTPMTCEERRERRRQNQRLRRQKLKSAKFEVNGEAELDVSRSNGGYQTYLERREAENAKIRERRRKLKLKMTTEQKAELNRKASMAKALRRAAMTEEQREEQRQKHYLSSLIRQSKKSDEELEAVRKKQRARTQAYKRKMLAERREEYLAKANQYMKQYWRKLSPEERRRRIAKIQASARRTPEQRERLREKNRLYWAKYKLRQKLAAQSVPHEQIAEKLRDFVANPPQRSTRRRTTPPKLSVEPALLAGITSEELRRVEQRFKVARRALRSKLEKAGVSPEEMEDKFKELKASYEKFGRLDGDNFRPPKLRPNETREQRDARLLKARVAVGQFNMRKRLFAKGVPPEVIEEKLRELVVRYEAKAKEPITFRPHKPRAKQERWIRSELQVASQTITKDLKVDLRQQDQLETPFPQSTSLQEGYLSDNNDWVEDVDVGSNDGEHKKFVPPPCPPKIPRRSPSGGTVSRPGPMVTCELCGNSYSHINKHMKVADNPNWVDGKCVLCRLEFSVGQKFLKHYNSAHVYPTLPKGKDGKVFRPRRRRRTIMTAEEEQDWKSSLVKCKLCPLHLSRSAIAEHKRVEHHPNYKGGKCSLCNTEFGRAVDFYEHFQSEHSEGQRKPWERKKNFVCSRCGDGFYSAQYLRKHENCVHDEGGQEGCEEQCPICGNVYRTPSILDEHLRKIHSEEDWTRLRMSMSAKWVECRRCGEKLPKNKELLEHVSSQHPDSYFPCPHSHCERLMYSEQSRNDHLLICKVSESRGRPSLQNLRRVPLRCELCAKEMTLDSLQRHYKLVHGVVEESWRCSLCPQTFLQRIYWLNHLDAKHGIPLNDELKEQASKLNVADRSQVEIRDVKGVTKRTVYKSKKKKSKRRSSSPKKSSMESSCSEDDEEKEGRTDDDEEIEKRIEEEGAVQKIKAIAIAVVNSRRRTRSRRRRPHIKPEIPEVEKEKITGDFGGANE